MAVLNDIDDIFSIFHDGGIVKYDGDLNLLLITIECEYLAEKINPDYLNFYIRLENVTILNFTAWPNPLHLPVEILDNPTDIFKAELEILYTDIKDNLVEISCNQHDNNFDYCGGYLRLSCENIEVFDHNFNKMSIDELNKICREYWDKL